MFKRCAVQTEENSAKRVFDLKDTKGFALFWLLEGRFVFGSWF